MDYKYMSFFEEHYIIPTTGKSMQDIRSHIRSKRKDFIYMIDIMYIERQELRLDYGLHISTVADYLSIYKDENKYERAIIEAISTFLIMKDLTDKIRSDSKMIDFYMKHITHLLNYAYQEQKRLEKIYK